MSTGARTRYEIVVARQSIEVVDRDTAEAVLFWDCTRSQLRRMREKLIADLDRLDSEEFLREWATMEPTDFG